MPSSNKPKVHKQRKISRIMQQTLLLCLLAAFLITTVLTYILQTVIGKKFGGSTVSDELGLPVTASGLALPCGATGRWVASHSHSR